MVVEVRKISPKELWQRLEENLVTILLFGGSRIINVDEVFAAYDGDKLVGAVSISPVGELNTGEPAIVGLFVSPSWRRQKIGTRLIEKAIKRMIERGLTPISIDLLSVASKKVIESMGAELKTNLIVNDQSEYDCFSMLGGIPCLKV